MDDKNNMEQNHSVNNDHSGNDLNTASKKGKDNKNSKINPKTEFKKKPREKKDGSNITKNDQEKKKHNKHKKDSEDEDDFFFFDEKPILIKIPNKNGEGEQEVELKSFVKSEYDGYVIKPREEIIPLPPEEHYGNTEYKRELCNLTDEKLTKRTTQMKFRLEQGNGLAIYVIGVEDDGQPSGLTEKDMYSSLESLCSMASNLKLEMTVLFMADGYFGKYVKVSVRTKQRDGIKLDIKIMFLGDRQSGKSTLIGVLTSGLRDNGKGSARMHVNVHRHELLTGETSSLSHHIMGFDSEGKVTNQSIFGSASWEEIVNTSTKVLDFLDIGGHQKYTNQLMSNLCSFYPDYALVVVSAKHRVTSVTEEHLRLACTFGIPIIIVITHIDVVKEGEVENVKSEIERTLRKVSGSKSLIPPLVFITSQDDNVLFSRRLGEKLYIPVFMISNVKGTNIDLFKRFLNLLPVNNPFSANIHLNSEFLVQTVFKKNNKSIIGGTVIKGVVKKKQVLLLGPDEKGLFRRVEVANIECSKVSVMSAYCGQSCTIEIKFMEEEWVNANKEAIIRRGAVLVDNKSQPKAAFEFTVELSLLDHEEANAFIWEGYEPIVISQTTHQACAISFKEVEFEQMTEEEIQKLRQKKSLNKEEIKEDETSNRKNSLTEELLLVPLHLNRQRSKSQDLAKEKQSFNEKVKSMKKSVFKGMEELVIKKKKRKFIRVNNNDKKLLNFKFKYYPEYITKGEKIIINDSTMKAIGIIKDVFYIDPVLQ